MLDVASRETVFEDDNNGRTIKLSDVLSILWLQKWCLVGAVLVFFGLGTLYLSYVEPTYNVAARVLVQPRGWPLEERSSTRSEEEFLATQSEIIRSPAVVERAIAKMPTSSPAGSNLVHSVLGRLGARPVAGTHVISLGYRCEDSVEGIDTVEAIVESYQQFLQETNDDSRLDALHLLTRSEEKLRSDLAEREARYREVRKKSPLADETVFQTSLLDNLGQKLTEVKARRIELQNRKGLMHSSGVGLLTTAPDQWPADSPLEQAIVAHSGPFSGANREHVALDLLGDVTLTGLPSIANLSQELQLFDTRHKALSQTYSADHPDVRAVSAQILTCRRKLSELAKQALLALEREVAATEAHENRLVEVYNEELEKAKAPDDFLVWQKQELDGIERLKTIYNSLVAQLNDWRLVDPESEGVWGMTIAVLEPPSTGSGPIWPKKSLLLSLFGMIGLLVGLGVTMLLERDMWSNHFRTSHGAGLSPTR